MAAISALCFGVKNFFRFESYLYPIISNEKNVNLLS